MPTLPIGTFDPTQAPSPDPYAGISPSTAAITPRHISSGLPGEPATTGTATLGTRTTPFPVQQDTHAEQAAWIARFNEFDRIKRQAEEDRAWNEMMQQNQRAQGVVRNVESARRFQAVRQYQNDYERLVSEGTDSGTAAYQSMLRNPAAFGTGFGSAIRALAPPSTATLGPASVVTDPESGKRIGLRIPGGPNSASFRMDAAAPRPGSLTQVDSARIRQLDREEKELKDALPSRPPGRFAGSATVSAYRATTNSIAQIRATRDKLLGGATTPADAAVAAPATSPSAPAAVQPSALVKVSTKAERDALPPGTRYIGPDGKTYTKGQ